MKQLKFLALSFIVLFLACDDVDPFDIEDVDFGNPEIGVPLINSTFFITDLGVDPDNNTEVISDSDGRVTLRYSDELEPVGISEVFPSVTNVSVSIENSASDFVIPFHDIDIRRGTLKKTQVRFEIENPSNNPISVTISIPDLAHPVTGLPFSETYALGPNESFNSMQEDLSEWMVNAPQGRLSINYCLLYTSPSPRDGLLSRMPSSA